MFQLARFAPLAALIALMAAALSTPSFAQPMLACGLKNQPAATLLLPYFEVDVENPAGRSTMFSVGNADTEAALAHAVIWTNWGHPVQSFDFFVPAGGVRSFNVRNILQGRLPETSPPEAAPEDHYQVCTTPLTMPIIDSEALTEILTGQPKREDGLCYSAAVEGGRLATGYITVDVVQDCSGPALKSPNDPNYYGDCATGLASNKNVLWGDFFLVDPEANSAQGEKLATLIADDNEFGPAYSCVDPPCGFRNDITFFSPEGNRMPLAKAYESRFLRGGGFDGGTELVVWLAGSVQPTDCGQTPASNGSYVNAKFRNEAGEALGSYTLPDLGQTFRVTVGSDALPVTQSFGSVQLSATGFFGSNAQDSPEDNTKSPPFVDLQLWVMPLVSGEGRYSVGLNTVPVKDFCYQ